MSESRRLQRVEKELQHLVANFLLKEFRGQLKGMVSVSRVESNPKLRTAKIYVSVFGSEEDKKYSVEYLQENIREIQSYVNKQLQMKFVPRLSVVLDTGLEKLLKVETLLRKISNESKARNCTSDENSEE